MKGKNFFWFFMILTLTFGYILAFSGKTMAQSKSWSFSENNNHLIALQKGGGDSSKAGPVKIDYFGHCAFRITSPKGLTILIDPWRNDPSGAWGLWYPNEFPEIPVDAVLSTHAHFDHDAVYRPHASLVLDRLAGVWSLADVKVVGLADKHQCKAPGWYSWTDAIEEFGQKCPPDNAMHLDNYIYIIETGGLRIAHWGDNRPDAAEDVLKALEGVDVLFITVDGSSHILSYDQIKVILDRVKPHAVIPMHYLTKGVSSTLSTLQNADKWVSTQPTSETQKEGTITLEASTVKKFDRKVIYFGDNFVKK